MDENLYTEFWNGQLLELFTSNKDSFFTQIIKHDDDLLVQRPVNRKSIPMMVDNSAFVTVYFQDDMKGLCAFDSKIYELEKGNIRISKPSIGNVKKAQRRRFFRVQVSVDLYLFLPSIKNSSQVDEVTAFTHDISGGGLSFLYPSKIVQEGEIIKGLLYLKTESQQLEVAFSGRIVYVLKQGTQTYRISLQFVDMHESIRSEIIRYCMFKQLELRNKIRGTMPDK